LLVPYMGELDEADVRLVELADFLGIAWARIPLPETVGCCPGPLEKAAFRDWCLVVNPRVLSNWMLGIQPPSEFAPCVISRFSRLLVHGVRPEPFDIALVHAFSGGRIRSIEECDQHPLMFQIPAAARDFCGDFAGLAFERTNEVPDRVFSVVPEPSDAHDPIRLGGLPIVTKHEWGDTEILFLGGAGIASLLSEPEDGQLSKYFSSFVAPAMALRYIFRETCWHPRKQFASVIVDDPLLRRNYGFLNFRALLDLMKERSFHTAVAFIPHNCRRSSAVIARLFRENSDWFSLCFHGNDHTGGEFAATDPSLLNTMLRIAERRMSVHRRLTGLECDRVMVFPQGKFSVTAMALLRARHFDAAVNTAGRPAELPGRLTLGELAQPAILRYAGFPLFLRVSSVRTRPFEIAFNLFFGRPVFIVEHHDGFQNADELLAAVSRINAIAPDVNWVSPGMAIREALLWRSTSGMDQVRAYSQTVHLSNKSGSPLRVTIEWPHSGIDVPDVGEQSGVPCRTVSSPSAVAVDLDLSPGAATAVSLFVRNEHPELSGLGTRWFVKAVVRRRLSEFRDNHLSRHPTLLASARAIQKSFLNFAD